MFILFLRRYDMENMLGKLSEKQGTVLLIALMMVTFLGALAVAVMQPVGTSAEITDIMYSQKMATLLAESGAERVKFFMTMNSAVPDDGRSTAVINVLASGVFTPDTAAQAEGLDIAGSTYPTVDMIRGNTSKPVFDYSSNQGDPKYPPIPGLLDGFYIVYTTDEINANTVSYVSAEYNGEIRNIKVTYRRKEEPVYVKNPLFNEFTSMRAAFGKKKTELRSNSWTDSWNSKLGKYPADLKNKIPAGFLGDVGSDGLVDMNSNSGVFGQVAVGPSASLNMDGTAKIVTGDPTRVQVDKLSNEQSFPTIEIPYNDVTSKIGTVSFGKPPKIKVYDPISGRLVWKEVVPRLGPGTIYAENIYVTTGGALEIVEGTTLIVNGDFITESNTSVKIVQSVATKPKPVKIFGTSSSSMDMNSNGSFTNTMNNAEMCRIYTDGKLHFESNSAFYGLIYAPNATMEIDSNIEVYGGIIANEVICRSNALIHWDEALLDADLDNDLKPLPDSLVGTKPTGDFEQRTYQYLD